MKSKLRIGCGAGFSGDRIEPAIQLAQYAQLDYLVLECLAERTIALAQKQKLKDENLGYDPLLTHRLNPLLKHLAQNKVKLITNMGAANPVAAAKVIKQMALEQGLNFKIAAVFGDDVLHQLSFENKIIETNQNFGEIADRAISANAYMGVEAILMVLEAGADIIITGRVADPSLFLAPMMYDFGWSPKNFDLLAKGTVAGHLLECAGQVTGGYFADPLKKPVDQMENLGHPYIEIQADGDFYITKLPQNGGKVDLMTVKEQLLYEVLNPFAYLTPDVSANFATVNLKEIGKDQVQIRDATGSEAPKQLKVSIGYRPFWKGEGEIFYAGTGALERAKLAGEIIKKRIETKYSNFRIDLIGYNAIHNTAFDATQPYEVGLRISAQAPDEASAALIGHEVEALYTNGPAGGGGVRKNVTEVIGILSTLIDRKNVQATFLIV